MSIQYYLLPNVATPDPNDQYARVETIDNLTPEDLSKELVARGNGASPDQILGIINAYEGLVAEKIAAGFAINTPLLTLRPGINGVFTDPNDSFDASRHVIRANIYGGPMLANKIAGATVEKILKPALAPVVVSFTNHETSAINATITAGGIGEISGDQLKFDASDADMGVYCVPEAGGDGIKAQAMGRITDGKVLVRFPALAQLPAGNYWLEVRRKFSGGPLRTGRLGHILTVSAPG